MTAICYVETPSGPASCSLMPCERAERSGSLLALAAARPHRVPTTGLRGARSCQVTITRRDRAVPDVHAGRRRRGRPNPIIVPRQEAYLQAIGLVGDSPWRTGQRWAPCFLSFDFNESLNSWKEVLDWPCGPNLDVVDLKNAGAMGMTAVDR